MTTKQEQPILLIDIKEAARMLSLSKSEVYEMLNRGELKGTPRLSVPCATSRARHRFGAETSQEGRCWWKMPHARKYARTPRLSQQRPAQQARGQNKSATLGRWRGVG